VLTREGVRLGSSIFMSPRKHADDFASPSAALIDGLVQPLAVETGVWA
jgi:hypothetical protein